MAEERSAIKPSTSGYGTIESAGSAGSSDTYEVHSHNLHGWRAIKHKFREPFAEFLGTFTFIAFGLGGVAQKVLTNDLFGNWLTIALSFGFGLALAIAVVGRVSGGHFNPAVTITMAIYRQFPWLKVPVYVTAQTAGAFVAAAVVYTNYHTAISDFDKHHTSLTAGIFATYPADIHNFGAFGAFFSEFLGTFFLVLVILGATDERNDHATKIVTPITIGLALTTIAISGGWETGFSLNPARDFGPRLFTFLAGYGTYVFSASNFYFWIPLVAPVVGGLTAGLVYDSLIYTGKSPLNHA